MQANTTSFIISLSLPLMVHRAASHFIIVQRQPFTSRRSVLDMNEEKGERDEHLFLTDHEP